MEQKALIFDIKRDCSEDGPGIRTTVFFKGCPLSCVWCHNPEGQEKKPELSFRAEACRPSECGAPCVEVCETGCLNLNSTLRVDHSACTRCDRCFDLCPTSALEPAGYRITVQELLYRVVIDRPFYRSTGGGVTLSGGEATMQMEFIHSFLWGLKQEGIHTALETCGFFDMETFRDKVLPFLDLIYYDLKLIDDEASRRHTGRSNRLILENFITLIREANIPIVPRIPLVPDITATRDNLTGLAHFLRRHGVDTCSLMPYNPLWHDKAKRLGLTPGYQHTSFMNMESESECADYFYDLQASTVK
ncbi:MAG: glycyl-radical enzyme activating protein [Thermodesulfobacteriota bacterium]